MLVWYPGGRGKPWEISPEALRNGAKQPSVTRLFSRIRHNPGIRAQRTNVSNRETRGRSCCGAGWISAGSRSPPTISTPLPGRQVRRGQIALADREHLRAWLARFHGRDDVAFAVEECTGWRYADRGADGHRLRPRPQRHAKTDKTDCPAWSRRSGRCWLSTSSCGWPWPTPSRPDPALTRTGPASPLPWELPATSSSCRGNLPR